MGTQLPPKGEHSSPPPLFGPYLLWPNGRPSQQLLSCCKTISASAREGQTDADAVSVLWSVVKLVCIRYQGGLSQVWPKGSKPEARSESWGDVLGEGARAGGASRLPDS